MSADTTIDNYEAFRRADGLWAINGTFYSGVFADSPTACNPFASEPVAFVGWIAGTEYADDSDFWETTELSDVESIEFMERDGFVLYDSPEGDARAKLVLS